MSLEIWTNVRFMLYPVMFVFGMAWGAYMTQQYRVCGHAALAWSAWLGWAVMALGASGFLALVVARVTGFSSTTSVMLTVGMFAVTGILVLGTLALWSSAWRQQREGAGNHG